MVFTVWSTIGLILMMIGTILVIVGVILYELNIQNRHPQQWYVWTLLILGTILAVVGAILVVMLMRQPAEVYYVIV